EDRHLDVGVSGVRGGGGERLADREEDRRTWRIVLGYALGRLEGHHSPLVGPLGGVRPCRKGLLARSRPIVVSGPWPGSTTVSSGSVRHTEARLRRIVG